MSTFQYKIEESVSGSVLLCSEQTQTCSSISVVTENVLQHDDNELGLAMSHVLATCGLLTGQGPRNTWCHIQHPHHDLPVS